jgi:hypothetical protein
MGRADELRAQLAAAEAEETALAALDEARAAYRAAPDDIVAKATAQAAAKVVRDTRAQLRAHRVVTAGPGDAVIAPAVVTATATTATVRQV